MQSTPRISIRIASGVAILAGTLWGSLAAPQPARASSVYVVNTLSDGNDGECIVDCTLREALDVSVSGDTVNFTVAGTITLSLGELVVDHNLTIAGPGADVLTIDAAGTSRVLNIGPYNVSLIGLKVKGGTASELGGGIYVDGFVGTTVFVQDVVVSGNQAGNASGSNYGGGLYMLDGVVAISNSEISNNTVVTGTGTTQGGGIYAENGTLNLTNVTISGNHAGTGGGAGSGGGLMLGSGLTANINNATIAGNAAGAEGGGLETKAGITAAILQNTIVADNSAPSAADCYASVGLYSGDYNLIEDTSSCTVLGTTTHNLVGVDPALFPLGAYSFPTGSMPLRASSPALDAGNSLTCAGADQRGIARPQGASCDIGAYERELHLFTDMPVTGKEWMEPWVNEFYFNGITTGCGSGPLIYCPENPVTRAAMAVFLLRAEHGAGYVPPAATHTFSDMPVVGKEWMEPWVDQLYAEGITSGCGAGPIFCPENPVTRAAMAVFLLRALEGSSYVPPAATHTFSDMPVAGKEWMEPWVDEFYTRGITTGCGAAPLIYCPENSVTRAAMAVFIDRAYGLYP